MTNLPTHDHLAVEHEDEILWLTFNRPDKLNCLRDDMLTVACEIVDAIENDDSVRAVVISGAGRCFSTGYDISPEVEMNRPQYSEPSRRFFKRRYALIDRIWNSPKPFIASVHGYCLAAASDIANVCDITIASDDAEFGYPAVRWGGHTHRLTYPWHMPIKKAKELMFTGDRISAEEAHRIGMVNRVVPRDQLKEETRKFAKRICLIPQSGLAVNKISMNYAYNVQGYQQAMQYSFQIAETNLWRDEPFFQKIREGGLNAALDWRDGKFKEKAEG
ncbi:MAG TPA: enoyl-CoA hydratase/isomerase family protein [Hyphomicrobiales bacterium]|nr:enoyl-CoA hydratase/isomerase family protein [Hyphomicrobiales bacterium]